MPERPNNRKAHTGKAQKEVIILHACITNYHICLYTLLYYTYNLSFITLTISLSTYMYVYMYCKNVYTLYIYV